MNNKFIVLLLKIKIAITAIKLAFWTFASKCSKKVMNGFKKERQQQCNK